jgi:sugar transferase EpsL
MYVKYYKWFIDIFLVLLSAVVTVPVILLLVLLVRFFLGRPVLFRQLRPGLYGKPFMIYKFRTMKNLCDAQGNFLPDEQRLTKFGNFLRKSSLDELPELFNVLKGDMSLVGPRPLLIEYLPRYSVEQMRRHDVMPGVTGWAQVNGRNGLEWNEKFKLDIWYVDNQSLLLDLKILWLTFYKVLRSEGVSQQGYATMREFKGDKW